VTHSSRESFRRRNLCLVRRLFRPGSDLPALCSRHVREVTAVVDTQNLDLPVDDIHFVQAARVLGQAPERAQGLIEQLEQQRPAD